jgi:predicted ester cyclase
MFERFRSQLLAEASMKDAAARVEQARQRWNAGDLPGYLSLYDERIALHGYTPEPMNKAAVTGFYQQIWSAFGEGGKAPPLTFFETLQQGELYCCRFVMEGKHAGGFMGVPATGRSIALPGITMMRFSGERVVERWSQADMLGLLVQIGAVPPPG